jgi:hypothetical protein
MLTVTIGGILVLLSLFGLGFYLEGQMPSTGTALDLDRQRSRSRNRF